MVTLVFFRFLFSEQFPRIMVQSHVQTFMVVNWLKLSVGFAIEFDQK